MILVTVGTQFFDELIAEVDRLVECGVIRDRVYAQIGLCRSMPRHLDSVRFDRNLHDRMREAELIITHAGTGCVIEAIELGKPFIAVVNGGKAGDHQREFLEQLEATHDFCWIGSPAELEAALPAARPARAREANRIDQLCDDLHRELRAAATMRGGGVLSRIFRFRPRSRQADATTSIN